ncbi:adhesion G protein-coupled receptor E3-like [Discoglossus pictus]
MRITIQQSLRDFSLSFLCLWVAGEHFIPPNLRKLPKCTGGVNSCPINGFCESNQWGNFCICYDGYEDRKRNSIITIPNGQCEDKDECQKVNVCKPPTTCNNTIGSYFCNCPAPNIEVTVTSGGINTTRCIDANKFICSDSSQCPTNAVCSHSKCYCDTGYQAPKGGTYIQPNEHCKDINVWSSTVENVTFKPEPEDIDECSLSPPPCIHPATCNNTFGSFKCNCPVGYSLLNITRGDMNLSTCVDIDECSQSSPPCIPPAYCNNTSGSFSCNCPVGYKLLNTSGSDRNMTTCIEIDVKCESVYNREELEKCAKQKQNTPFCSTLDTILGLQNSSCQRNKAEPTSLNNITENFSKLLNDSSTWSSLSPSQLSVTVTTILIGVESTALASFINNPRNERVSNSEIEIETKVAQNSCILETFIKLNVEGSDMEVSCKLLPRPEDGAILIAYRNLNSNFNSSNLIQDTAEKYHIKEINSQVVTGAITRPEKENLFPPIRFYIHHLVEPDKSTISLCVFWNPRLGGWSTEGCDTEHSNASHTLCACSHLSSFAIITAHRPITEDAGLILLSRIGLSISLLCLFLSLLTFLLCRSLRSAHTSILSALCGCLFLAQLLILVGLQQTSIKLLCSIIAGSLHFLLLCAFCWMSLESILLFLTVRNLRAVNYMTSQRSNFPKLCVVGFGVPVIIVTISAAIRSDEYGTEKHCWLNNNLIWSFLGPVCVFIIMNTTLLILTFVLLRSKLASLNTNVSTLKNTQLLTFKAMAQLFILGSSWSLGFFQFGHSALIFSYLFTIFNSLQGAFIFLVHCLLNRQVREEYHKAFRRLHTSKAESDIVSGSTFPMTIRSTETSVASKSEEKQPKTVQWS